MNPNKALWEKGVNSGDIDPGIPGDVDPPV